MDVVVVINVGVPPFTEYFMPVESVPFMSTTMVPGVMASMVSGVASVTGSASVVAVTAFTLRLPL